MRPPLAFPDDLPFSAMPRMAFPVLPRAPGLVVLGWLWQLERTQWWSPEALASAQLVQLDLLLRHARATTRYWPEVLGPAEPLTEEAFRRLPILSRAVVQDRADDLTSRAIPREHGDVHEVQSTGSTGRRVVAKRTRLAFTAWCAVTLREHAWHGRDLSAKLGVVRHADGGLGEPPGTPAGNWGAATAQVYRTGPTTLLSIHAELATQAEWLEREAPDYLLTYPSALRGLAEHYRRRGVSPPRLRGLRTISEALSPEDRAFCQEVFGAPLQDLYSTVETGYLALQCPDHPHYHVQSETMRVEVLREDGTPCGPGEVGRVIVTPLHNFATVLVRYDVGDYAEVGEPCPCGRGLPVLTRIVGRVRNLLTLPDGRRTWPRMNAGSYERVAPVRQVQLVQRSLERIEARFATTRPVTAQEEAALRDAVRAALGHPFEVDVVLLDEIPRGAGGKYEDFRSEL